MNESLVNIEKKALEWLKLNLKKQKLVHKKNDIDTEIISYLYFADAVVHPMVIGKVDFQTY